MDPYRQPDPEMTLAEAREKAAWYRAEWRRAKEALHEQRRLEQEDKEASRRKVYERLLLAACVCLLFGGITAICGMFVWWKTAETRAAEQAIQNPGECDLQLWRRAEKPAPCACYADTPMRDVPFRCSEKK